MKFSDMKLVAKNAVRAYFVRSWSIEDLMNNGEIPQQAYKSLKKVYLTLFFAMWSFTFGSFLHWTRGAGGQFTVLCSVASLLCLYFISPLRVRTRVLLLMIAAFSIGASIGIFIKYFVDIDHGLVYTLLAPPTFAIGFLWFGSMFTRERSDIYLGCVYYCWALCFSTFVVSNADYVGSRAAHFLYKVCIVLALFLGYIVVYTQEILYDAHFGEINFVNRTLTIVFRLPGIVVHAARLCLIQCIIEQHR
ncbi:bax inhibitor 1-like isoform X1 [Solanum lycopersicum]|uniref:bax inhibitor 1-like isoform X1 n=1 Tax=Solanum lycopersicum TaxID=4081 RepID=UPI0008FECE90|nr:bax inhibitor 1-like isoform X1 [Solanum lycopersicum]